MIAADLVFVVDDDQTVSGGGYKWQIVRFTGACTPTHTFRTSVRTAVYTLTKFTEISKRNPTFEQSKTVSQKHLTELSKTNAL
jgi:hypothetical protein